MAKRFLLIPIILSLALGMFSLPLPVLGQTDGAAQIPPDIRQVVPENDWVELYYFEAKARGGEAVARAEALGELLPPLLAEARELGIEVKEPDYLGIARDLEAKLEAIGQQDTLEAAQAKLQNFLSAAEEARTRLGSDLRGQIEGPLRAKGEELRTKLEKELRAEGEALGQEAEARLRAQAQAEAREIEENLRVKIQKQVEKELMAQYGGQKDVDINYLMELGQKMGMERGAKAAKKARTELSAKYERLAREDRERITQIMEAKANRIGGEEKQKLEAIRDGFADFEGKLEALTEVKMERWRSFRDKAVQKRKEILMATMGAQIDEGKKLIMTHKSEIDEARKEGKNIPSAEELVARLEKDKQTLIDRLTSAELNEEAIRRAGEELRSKWNGLRLEMEKLRGGAAAEIYAKLEKKLSASGFDRRRLEELNPEQGTWQELLRKRQESGLCRTEEPQVAGEAGEGPFAETFDDLSEGSIYGQNDWYGKQLEQTSQEVQTAVAKGGKAVRFYDNNPSYGQMVWLSRNFTGSTEGSAEADIMASSESNGNPRFHFILGDYGSGEKIYTYLLTDGHFGYWSGGNSGKFRHFPRNLEYSLDRWYRIKIEWHPNQTFDFYVDGRKLNTIPMKNSYPRMTRIDFVRFYSDFWEANPRSNKYRGNKYGDYPSLTPSVVYLDNVRVTSGVSFCADLISLAELEKKVFLKLKEFLSYTPSTDVGELLKYKNGLLMSLERYRQQTNAFKMRYGSSF